MKIFEKLFVAFLALVISISPVLPQAALLPNAKQQYFDANGNPLANGTVTFYVPNTSTKKTTWSNATETTANTNPVQLDAAGRATIYGQGSYRQLVKDSSGNTIWDTVTTAPATVPGTYVTDVAPVGTLLPFAGTTPPTNYLFAYGQQLSRTTYSELYNAITIAQTGSCTISSTTLSSLTSTEQIKVGAPVEATCLAPGATVAAILSSTSIQVSSAAINSASTTIRVFPWGNGNGGTTFNAPDMRGRALVGRDDMGSTAANVLTYTYCDGASALLSLGSYCGAQSHTMTLSELVTHSHGPGTLGGTTDSGGVQHTHTSGTLQVSAGQGSHSHSQGFTAPGAQAFQSGSGLSYTNGNTGSATLPALNVDTGSTGNASAYLHTHAFTATTGTTANAGSSSAFSVVQPVTMANYIVKYTSVTPGGVGGVISIGGMTGDIICGTGVTCDTTTNTLSVSGAGGGSVVVVTSGTTYSVPSTASFVIINQPGVAMTLTLPDATARTGEPLEIYCWSGSEGNITVNPAGSDTIMGLSSWTLVSGGAPGAGASVRLVPSSALAGWASR